MICILMNSQEREVELYDIKYDAKWNPYHRKFHEVSRAENKNCLKYSGMRVWKY